MKSNWLTVFISHRPADKGIADILKNVLQTWGSDNLCVYQSADLRENCFDEGRCLTDAQKKILTNTNVLFLIHTINDNDWYFCMYECGLATSMNGNEVKIVVFQFSSSVPASLEDQMRVSCDEKSIQNFVNNLHKDPTFFSKATEAFTPNIDKEILKFRSTDLYKKLCRYGN